MAAGVANQVNARVLALNHLGAVHQNETSEWRLIAEAEGMVQNKNRTQVQLGYDLLDFFVPRKGFPSEWK